MLIKESDGLVNNNNLIQAVEQSIESILQMAMNITTDGIIRDTNENRVATLNVLEEKLDQVLSFTNRIEVELIRKRNRIKYMELKKQSTYEMRN